MDLSLEPTVAGAALAALAVAGGGPLFSAGLRAFRLGRRVASLAERPLAEAPSGFLHTRGKVVLDSPLFSPLSGRPCAGFRLDVRGQGTRAAASIEERRPFRIVSGEVSARVMARSGRWRVAETARREITPGQPLSENLATLLQGCPEAFWLQRQGLPLVITEYALLAGGECHVIGQARHGRPYELPAEMELARTGTDDQARMGVGAVTNGDAPAPSQPPAAPTEAPASARAGGPFGIERRQPGRPFPAEVDLWVDGGGLVDFVLVSDAPPQRADLAVSPWRTLGLVVGPVMSMAGLLYLAHAADVLRTRGRF
jgi:hypothetical protein